MDTGTDRQGAVLVTGAAGFIGSHVVEALVARGEYVVGLDNFDPFYDPALKRANVAACVAAAKGVKGVKGSGGAYAFVQGDICDETGVGALMKTHGVRRVVHLAAKAGVRPSIADPVGYARANLVGTSAVLACAERAGCGSFVFGSSSSVYGNSVTVPFSEEQAVEEPISPYAATKRAGELMCYTGWRLSGMPIACARFFTVFGPRQRPDLAISLFMRRLARGEAIDMFGDGSMSRDFTYVDDIVSGVLAALDRAPGFGYRVWNLGGSKPVTVKELIEAVAEVVGVKGGGARVNVKPMQAGDVERTYADLKRSGAELGYVPRTGLREGLEKQWAWMRERMDV